MRISRTSILWTLLGVSAYVLSFPQWDIFQLTPIALFGYLFAFEKVTTMKQALFLGFLASFVIGLGGFHWIAYVSANFGNLPMPLAVLVLLLFCFMASPQVLSFFVFGRFLRPHVQAELPRIFLPFFWAFLYVAIEFLFNRIKIFPEYLGSPWINSLSIAQGASIGGAPLLSFLPALLGASLYSFIRDKKTALPAVITALGLFFGLHLWGEKEIARWENVESAASSRLRVAIVQANIGDVEKVAAEIGRKEGLEFVVKRYLDLSKEAAARSVDLVVWPETAFPLFFPFPKDRPRSQIAIGYTNLMQAGLRATGVPHLIGTYEHDGSSSYNAGALLNRNAEVLSTYRKSKLLILGEYMPFSQWFPELKKLNPNLGDFGHGEGPFPLDFRAWPDRSVVRLGLNICYEAIMPDYMRELARQGSSFFLNLTNDSWFGPTFEPWQHLQLAQLRTIENRLPMVRATNTGVSAFISSVGKITAETPLFQAQVLVDTVPIINSESFYRRYGDVFAWIAVLISFAFIAAAFSLPRFLPKRR